MKQRNRLKAVAMAVLLALGGAYALASWDWCRRERVPPKVLSRFDATGPLQVGSATVELKPPFPIVVAGYGPPRPEATSGKPLKARAVVLREGDVTFGLVAIDLLLIPDDVATEVRAASGLSDAWVVATHTHSSFGGYDQRLIAQLAGTGRFRADARKVVVDAAVAALKEATSALKPVERVTLSEALLSVSNPRSGDASDHAIRRLQLGDAMVTILAAHPTLVGRPATALDPDYPGQLPGLVLQGAGGNASATNDVVDQVVGGVFVDEALESPSLQITRVQFAPPTPDASRLVPRLFAMPGHNFLCSSAPLTAEVGVLRLGKLTLAAIPAEVTFGAAQELGVPIVSLANGYLGYVEPAGVVDRGEGEARRQYYDRTLLETIRAAVALTR